MTSTDVLLDVQATQSAAHRDRGVARYVTELASALLRRDDSPVHSLLLNPDLAPPGRVEPLVASGRLVYSDRCDLRGARLLHITSPFELEVPLGQLWLRRGGAQTLPLVVTLYDLIPEVFAERYLEDAGLRHRYRARRELLRAADLVCSISDASAADAVDRLHIAAERIVVVGAAAPAHFTPPGSRVAAQRAARLAIPELGERFVLYTGGMDDRKNFERLFHAWSLLPPSIRDSWQLVMACAMHDLGRNHLRYLARGVGIDERLVLPGFVSDDILRVLYQATDLFVFPSLYEGFGLPVAEALACGALTIGSNTSAVPELLVPEACFDPTDAGSIAEAIERALTDDARRAVLAEQCARPRADWDAVAERTAAAYDQVLTRKPRARRRKPLVAVVTPLPPARSSIADYSFELLSALREHCEIHAYADGERWVTNPGRELRAPEGIPVLPIGELVAQERARGGYDCVVYCLGNSEYHAGALAQLRRRRGIVLAHDVRMNDLYALSVDEPGALPAGFHAALVGMYGELLPREVAESDSVPDEVAERLGLLMAREVVDLSDRFVVMSDFAARLVQLDACPEHANRIAVVPFGRHAPVPGATPTELRAPIVATFGIVNEVKQTTLLVQAFPLVLDKHPDAQLAFVGRCSDEDRRNLVDLAEALGVRDRVIVTGEVGTVEYASWLDRAAVAAQLRRTSNGECSGAVSDCMAGGVALVVTDIGASRELPEDCAHRVDPAAGVGDLGAAIADLIADPGRRARMVEAARGYARAHSFGAAADRLFHDVIAPGLARPLAR